MGYNLRRPNQQEGYPGLSINGIPYAIYVRVMDKVRRARRRASPEATMCLQDLEGPGLVFPDAVLEAPTETSGLVPKLKESKKMRIEDLTLGMVFSD
jgi:hypothetical protein